jgi:hypothetical protein
MFRSTLLIVQRLSDRLLLVPGLVRGFQRKSPGAVADLLRWIDDTETAMSGHGMVAAADLAGLKARILAPTFDDDRRTGARRRQFAAAVALVHELQQATQDALRPLSAKVEQTRGLVRQLLQIVAQSGAVQYDPASDATTMVEQIWALATAHEQLRPIVAQMRSLLPADDIRMLLAEEFDPLDFPLATSSR